MTINVEGSRDLARLVRQARLGQHLSQGALAERIGITRQAVANLESGRTVPSVAIALAAVRALGMQVQVVTEGTEQLQQSDAAVTASGAAVSSGGVRATITPGPVDLDAVLDRVRQKRGR